MSSLTDLLRRAGLSEAEIILPPDEAAADAEQDRLYDARRQREEHVIGLIAYAFRRCGVAVAQTDHFGPAIHYDEDDREALVEIDDSEADLAVLAKLLDSGLSDRFVVQAGSQGLGVLFSVSDHLASGRPA